MMRCKGFIFLLAVLATMTFDSAMARAGDDSAAIESGALARVRDDVVLEDMTVTASKRETSYRDFPGSLTVRDEAFMEDHGIESLSDLTRYVPNVVFKKATSSPGIFIRGLSTIDTSLFNPAGLYVDDVPYPLSYMLDQELFDVERVEVLRGPQATLYGRNSESGVINVVYSEPDNQTRAKVMAETGTFQTVKAGFAAKGPLVEDRLFYDFSVLGQRTDGYVENEFLDQDDVAGDQAVNGRARFRWTPTGAWDISLGLDAADRKLGMGAMRLEDGPKATDWLKGQSNEEDTSYVREFGQVAKIQYQWPEVHLTSISSHRFFHKDFIYDIDRTSSPLGHSDLNLNRNSFSQEIRLTSWKEKRLSWLWGLYGSTESLDVDFDFNHVSPMMAKKRSTESDLSGYATFGQATYKITDRFRLTGGLRLDLAHGWGRQTYATNMGTVTYEDEIDETNWLPMASLAYDLGPHLTTYATYAQGFMAGGYNYYSATNQGDFTYDAEHTANYEVGLKSNWLDHRLTANLSLFYTEIRDKQVREEVPGGMVATWKFSNAARAHSTGLELEMDFRPLPELELFGGFGYAATKADDWTTVINGVSVDYSGHELPWAPEFTYNFGVNYNHRSGFFSLVDFLGSGEQYFDAANTLKENGYMTVNGRIGYRTDRLEVAFWCDNLLNERYATQKLKNSMGYTLIEDGAPRTFGITLNWRM